MNLFLKCMLQNETFNQFHKYVPHVPHCEMLYRQTFHPIEARSD